jgi:perosamine synthetase
VAIAPVDAAPLPYGRQEIDDDDVAAVVAALHSDWLTTGPLVGELEQSFAAYVGSGHAVAVSSGTAALHAAYHVLDLAPGDEIVVPALTFVASANAAVFEGATPVFADVEPGTLLIDPRAAAALVGPRTKAIVGVDYAGQPCDWDALRAAADAHGLALVADGCHAPGARDGGRTVGTLADLTAFSLHPVKHFTTGEGGLVTTDDAALAARMRRFRNHGIGSDHRERAERGTFAYEMVELGFNYRLTDFQCALGISQLRHLDGWLARRRDLASRYDDALAGLAGVEPLAQRPGADHAYHLYVVQLADDLDRDAVFTALRGRGIGANVHYLPVHLHAFYRERFGTGPGLCPVAEAAYERILSLPLFPAMADDDVDRVVDALAEALA